jgi:hypothetical protein
MTEKRCATCRFWSPDPAAYDRWDRCLWIRKVKTPAWLDKAKWLAQQPQPMPPDAGADCEAWEAK